MLFQLHAGFEPTLPRWLSAGWNGYYILYYMHIYCEGHPLNLSNLTLHQPQTSSPNQYRRLYDIWKLLLCISLLGGSVIMCQ